MAGIERVQHQTSNLEIVSGALGATEQAASLPDSSTNNVVVAPVARTRNQLYDDEIRESTRQKVQVLKRSSKAYSHSVASLRGGGGTEVAEERYKQQQRKEKESERFEKEMKEKVAAAKKDIDLRKAGKWLAETEKKGREVIDTTSFKGAARKALKIDMKAKRRERLQRDKEIKASGADKATINVEILAEKKRQKEREKAELIQQHEKLLTERGEHVANASARAKYKKLQASITYQEKMIKEKQEDLEEDLADAIRGASLKDRTRYNDSFRMSVLRPNILHDGEVLMGTKEYKKTVKREIRERGLTQEEKQALHTRRTWWAWAEKHRQKKRFRAIRELATRSAGGYDPREEAAKQYHFVEKDRKPRRTVRYWERWFTDWDKLGPSQRRSLLRIPSQPWIYDELRLREIANHNWTRVGEARPHVLKRMRLRLKQIKNAVESLWTEWSEPQLAYFLNRRHRDGLFDLGSVQRMLLKTKFDQLEMDETQKVLRYFATTKDGTKLLEVGVDSYVETSPNLIDRQDYQAIIGTGGGGGGVGNKEDGKPPRLNDNNDLQEE
eukprot:jgi/Bigna1/132287/aug1.17_g6995